MDAGNNRKRQEESIRMRKNRIFKCVMAALLSAGMVLTGVNYCPGGGQESKAAVTLPTPIYENDFEKEDTAKGTIVGGGSIVNATDTTHGKVFENAAVEGGDTKRANFFQLPAALFNSNAAQIAEKKGITVSFAVNANGKSVMYSPVFSAYGAAPANGQNTFPMFIIQGRQLIQFNANGFCNFTDADNVNGKNVESIDYMKDNGWHTVTVTISDNKAVYYVDGLPANSWNHAVPGFLNAAGIGSLNYICLGGNQAWNWADDDAFYQFDDVKIYAEALSSAQVYKLATGSESSSDKTNLEAALAKANAVRQELYTEQSLTEFRSALANANGIMADGTAEQAAVDAAESDLLAVIGRLVKKDIDLSSGLLLNTDFTSSTAAIDNEKNIITAGGYTIKPLGTSSIQDGYIQSATTKDTGKAGISLDTDLLKNAALESGLSFNVEWKFENLFTGDTSDFGSLLGITDSSNKVLLMNTIGFVTVLKNGADGGWYFPGSDCRNGFAWDSCKQYDNTTKKLTFTMDRTGYRMYVDGVLACEKTSMAGFDFADMVSSAANIMIGRDCDETSRYYDIQGQLRGIQVYNRALNAAEVEELASKGVTDKTVSAVIKASQGASAVIREGTKEIARAAADADGNIILKGLADNKTYSYEILLTSGAKVTGEFSAKGSDLEIAPLKLTGIEFKEKEVALENIKNTADGHILPASKQLTVVYTPDYAVDKEVEYSSSNPDIVSVDAHGLIKASENVTQAETVTITATAKGDNKITAVCTVNVSVKEMEVIEVQEIQITPAEPEVEVGKTIQLTADITPANATIKNCEWSSSDETIAEVDGNGLVTGVKEGSVVITAKAADGSEKTANVTLTVKKASIPVTGIALDKTKLDLEVGGTADLKASITPDTAANKTVLWTSSDETLAKVENGKVTALKAGIVTITAASADNPEIKAECAVTIKEAAGEIIKVTGITLDKTAMELKAGETGQLTAAVAPADATDKEVEWVSEEPAIATVDSTGKVTAVKAGKTKVHAISRSDKTISADCVITVTTASTGDSDNKNPDGDKKPDPGPGTNGGQQASISLSKANVTLYTGKAGNSAVVKPTVQGTTAAVSWTSSNKKIATVTGGTIKAVKKGTAVITATVNGVSATVKVTVKNPSIKVKKGKKAVSKVTVKRKKSVKLTVTVSPAKSGMSLAKLSAKNKKTAKVTFKKGRLTIKGKKKGKLTLKIKSGKGVKSFKVTVK